MRVDMAYGSSLISFAFSINSLILYHRPFFTQTEQICLRFAVFFIDKYHWPHNKKILSSKYVSRTIEMRKFYCLSSLKNKSWNQAISLFSCILCLSLLTLLCNILPQKSLKATIPLLAPTSVGEESVWSLQVFPHNKAKIKGPGQESASKLFRLLAGFGSHFCKTWVQFPCWLLVRRSF